MNEEAIPSGLPYAASEHVAAQAGVTKLPRSVQAVIPSGGATWCAQVFRPGNQKLYRQKKESSSHSVFKELQ